MNIAQATILGIIQGITEWLPISSSGHLVIAQEFFGLQNYLFFDILLHIATALVVIVVFRKDIFEIIKALINRNFNTEYGKLAIFIIIGSIPTAIIGILFGDIFEKMFSSLWSVATALMATGILLLLTKLKTNKPSRNLNKKDSLFIGFIQGIAIIPGISRSGTTIGAGMLSGIAKEKIARFSFLLSIPAIIGAFLLKFNTIYKTNASNFNWVAIIAGMLAALIVGYLSLKLLLKIIKSDKFYIFGYYCIALSIILINILIFTK